MISAPFSMDGVAAALDDPSLRQPLLAGLRAFRDQVAAHRPPDVIIGGAQNPYMRRWWLVPRNALGFNLYLHQFRRSDDDRALHDHPWANLSILIEGSYREHQPVDPAAPAGATQYALRCPGDIAWRSAETAHRIELLRDGAAEIPVWTLFVTGPKVRDWGFWCPRGWTSWQAYTGQDESNGPVRVGEVLGAGCGED